MTVIDAIAQTITDLKTWVNNNIDSIRIKSVVNNYDHNENVNTLQFIGETNNIINEVIIKNSTHRGIMPKLKIEDNKWYASYDNKITWEYLYETTPNNIK